MKKNVLYIGKLYPSKILATIIKDSKGKVCMSNHNFEMSLVNGLCLQGNIDLKCVIIPGVYSFPQNNKRFYTSSEHYKYKNAEIYSVNFCNLPIIKELWSTIICAWKIIKCSHKFKGSRVDVIMNTPDNRFFNALKIAKFFVKKVFTQTVIIPDIPSMVSSMSHHNLVKNFLLNKGNKIVMKRISNVDGLVLLTEAMMDFVSKPVKHIVMEGIVDVDTMDVTSEDVTTDKQIILYTGTLRKIFGVMNLVNAFQQIPNKNTELWICGSGDAKEDIKVAANRDERIKFFGLVDSKTALRMQHQATILVNPRTSEGEYTKYSFPSKTIEYLLAGKSVVINRLPGIPDEYYNYTYTPKDESVSAFATCIMDVLNMDKNLRNNRAIAGRKFIIEQKNSVVQIARIINMLDTY